MLLFIADGLAKLCAAAREQTELLFIMQFLWKMQMEFWNIVLWTSFVGFCLKRHILIVCVELTLRKKVKLGGMHLCLW